MTYIGELQGYKVYKVNKENDLFREPDVIYALDADCGYDLYLFDELIGWADARWRVQECNISRDLERRVKEAKEGPVRKETKESPSKKETTKTSIEFWSRIENDIKTTLASTSGFLEKVKGSN